MGEFAVVHQPRPPAVHRHPDGREARRRELRRAAEHRAAVRRDPAASQEETGMMLAVIASVAWLQGCWQMTSGDRVVEEQWMAPRAGVMLNAGRTVRGDTLVEYEWVLLAERDGKLTYEAHPSGQPAAVFTAQE